MIIPRKGKIYEFNYEPPIDNYGPRRGTFIKKLNQVLTTPPQKKLGADKRAEKQNVI
jgi:hypothetical protein